MLVCETHVEAGRVDPIHVDMEQIRVMFRQSDDVLFAFEPSDRAGDLEERRMRAKYCFEDSEWLFIATHQDGQSLWVIRSSK